MARYVIDAPALPHLAVTKLQADALITVDPDLAARAKDIAPVEPLTALLVT